MMNLKRYRGYTSFQYLKANQDYKQYELDDRIPRVSGEERIQSKDEQDILKQIFSEYSIISLRDHGFIVPSNKEEIRPYCSSLHTAFNYKGIAESGVDIIFENFMDGISTNTSKNGLKWDDVINLLGIRYADIAFQDTVFIGQTFDDFMQAKSRGQTALLPSLESASILENEIDRVDILYGFGIRCMGITYNQANTLGSGLTEKRDGGLTKFGHNVINRMNQLGMLIDISHCGDLTSLDVIEASEHPVLMTHAGARALWNTPRMKPDHVLQACANKGGIIGICAAPNTTLTKSSELHTLDTVMEHFEYIKDLVGIRHVGFGPDTFYGDHVALQHAFDDTLGISESHSGENFKESVYVHGVENPTEAMKNMIAWMIQKSYSQQEISLVAGGNALSVMKTVFQQKGGVEYAR